jgi:hypothetical protein
LSLWRFPTATAGGKESTQTNQKDRDAVDSRVTIQGPLLYYNLVDDPVSHTNRYVFSIKMHAENEPVTVSAKTS